VTTGREDQKPGQDCGKSICPIFLFAQNVHREIRISLKTDVEDQRRGTTPFFLFRKGFYLILDTIP